MSRQTTLEKAIGDILTREDEIIAAIHAGTGSALFSDTEIADTIGKNVSKTLTKAYQQSADSVITITGPGNAAKCEQVREVALYLAQAPRGTSIHTACKRAFRPVKGGYKSAESLFIWCHRNDAKLMNYVNELRLQV